MTSSGARPAFAPFLISVIIPTYNSDRCIGRCLDSLRQQTFENYEIIIMDGGSTDGTLRVIEEQAVLFSHLTWRSEKDRGVYDAMNKAVALARGEWLLFLGSDDALYAPDVLTKMASHFSPKYDFIYGNVYSASASSWAAAGTVYNGEFDNTKIVERNICHQAIFYSKTLFARSGGYDLSYRVLADWEFNLRIFRKSKKKFVDLIVANFEGGGMSTALTDHEFVLRFPEIVGRAFRLPARAPFFKVRHPAMLELGKYHWSRGQHLHSLRFFWIWLANANSFQIRQQARELWHARRILLKSL